MKKAKKETLSQRDYEVIKSLAENNLCITHVSRAMYLHYNSIVYYVKKIKRITGLNPTKFYDLIALLELIEKEEKDKWLSTSNEKR